MRYMYPAIFTENELDGYSVQFVDFENGYTCGDDMEDAVAMAAVLFAASALFIRRQRYASL